MLSLLWVVALWSSSPASAQPGPVKVREYVPNLRSGEVAEALAAHGVRAASSASGALPSGPALNGAAGPGQGQEVPGQRSPRFRPDRQTSLEEPLPYYPTFVPSVAPFKRVTSLDALVLSSDGRTPLLTVSEPAREAVRVGPVPVGDEPVDRFVGQAQADFSAGPVVPLPTVAPTSRVLSLVSEPHVGLRVERDRADNYVLVATSPVPDGPVSIRYELDAPRAYFGASIPDTPLAELSTQVPPLPTSIRRRGLAFAAELGIDPRGSLRDALYALVDHFRAFEESSDPLADSGDVYLDLSRGGKGICRHRAYAFMVTAQALGIPTRFVQNEAHSFVEVELSQRGFLRIDLGGAAGGLSSEALTDRAMYAPDVIDDLPRPATYERSYAEATAMATSGSSGQRRVGQWLPIEGPMSAARATSGSVGAGPDPQDQRAESRIPVELSLDQPRLQVRRGHELRLSGTARTAAGRPAPGLPIEISLGTPERHERMYLGTVFSAADGRFVAVLHVPQELARGTYQLHVLTAGDARFGAAIVP